MVKVTVPGPRFDEGGVTPFQYRKNARSGSTERKKGILRIVILLDLSKKTPSEKNSFAAIYIVHPTGKKINLVLVKTAKREKIPARNEFLVRCESKRKYFKPNKAKNNPSIS
jgi:hypothetical protein